MPVKRNYGATYERIREWMMYSGSPQRPSAPKLWEEDKVVWERLVQLKALLFQKAFSLNDAQAAQMKMYNISEATFYRDYKGLVYIFGDLLEENKDFERSRLKEIQQKVLQMALKNNDLKAANAAIANLIKLGGHDRDDKESVPLELLNPGAYALVLDEAGQKAIKALLDAGPVVDLSSLMGEDAQEIDFEEIPKEAAGSNE